MKLRKFVLFLFLLLFTFNIALVAQAQILNVGFVPANIWYSEDSFEDGDQIKIYTLVFNPDDRELSGTVIFFNDEVLLGSKKVTVRPKSTEDVSIDWKVTSGKNIIFAKLESAKFINTNGTSEEIFLAKNQTQESEISIKKKIDIKEVENKTVNNVNTLIKENTPAVVSDTVSKTTNALENVRNKVVEDIVEKQDEIKESLAILDGDKKVTEEEATDSKDSEVLTEEEKLAQTKEALGEIKTEEGNKEEVKKENQIENKKSITQKTKNNTKITDSSGKIAKPLKQIQLFFLSILYFIFNHKIIFYLLILLSAFFILRFIWRLIFK